MSLSTGSEILLAQWLRAYRKRPLETVLFTLLCTVGVILSLTFYPHWLNAGEERKRAENLSYDKQLQALNRVASSLQDLIDFVEAEKGRLKETEDVLNRLKTERATLTPLIEADRKTVQAIFELQARMNREGVWRDRVIVFVLGVMASIIASFIYGLVRSIFRGKKAPGAISSRAEP